MASSKQSQSEVQARREFLGQIGKAAVTAPAVALLLASSAKPASAQQRYAPPGGGGEVE